MSEYQCRMIIISLLRVIEGLCDQFCKNADRIPEVVVARASLNLPLGEKK